MLATCFDIARVRTATERSGEAVELLATVLTHPAREQHGHFRPTTIQEDAERLRADLEKEMAAEAYAAAWRKG